MDFIIIIALVITIPIILFPAAFVWYLNAGGLWTAYKAYIHEKRVKKPVVA